MSKKIVTGLCKSRAATEDALRQLEAAGFTESQISLLLSDDTQLPLLLHHLDCYIDGNISCWVTCSMSCTCAMCQNVRIPDLSIKLSSQ